MEIISGNKTCVLTANESNAKKDVIAIVTGIKVISKSGV
jgi:hypothetical protein